MNWNKLITKRYNVVIIDILIVNYRSLCALFPPDYKIL